MARPLRIWHPSSFYHVTVRGNNRQNIFTAPADFREYFRILHYVHGKYDYELYAYCLMHNHVHFLLQSPEVHLGKVMGLLNKRYSDYFRYKYDYSGQIYENRYFSKEIVSPISLLNVGAYIHRNPIETKVPIVSDMEDFMFSFYQYYFYNRRSPYTFLNLDMLPALLPEGRGKSKIEYAKYCIEYRSRERDEVLT